MAAFDPFTSSATTFSEEIVGEDATNDEDDSVDELSLRSSFAFVDTKNIFNIQNILSASSPAAHVPCAACPSLEFRHTRIIRLTHTHSFGGALCRALVFMKNFLVEFVSFVRVNCSRRWMRCGATQALEWH